MCPKCGSHRTEVVGRSQDGRTLTLRCNGCGERSIVDVDPEDAARRLDALTLEADALHVIATALSELPDDAARERVLRWANKRFGLDASPLHAPESPAPADAPDATLAVADLHELFAAPRDGDADLSIDIAALDQLAPIGAAAPPCETFDMDADRVDAPPVTRGPAALFTQPEAAVVLSGVIEPPASAPTAAPASQPIENARPDEKIDADADFEATVHSFVADLQRLARDWETVFVPPDPLAATER